MRADPQVARARVAHGIGNCLLRAAQQHDLTIAVMGCRVNGPGETDDADLGLWCGPTTVNLKRGEALVGNFGYDEVMAVLRKELDALIEARRT